MRARSVLVGSATLAVVACTAPLTGAYGFDLTGTWVGSQTCKVSDGLVGRDRINFGPANAVRITQTGNNLAVVMTSATLGTTYHGQVIERTTQPRNGWAILTECRSNTALSAYSEVAHLTGTADAEVGRLRGESIVRTPFGEVGRCKWRLTRASSQNPAVKNLCPCCQ
jgi:hypothetical protein